MLNITQNCFGKSKNRLFICRERMNLGLIKTNSKGMYRICQVGRSDLVAPEMAMEQRWHSDCCALR